MTDLIIALTVIAMALGFRSGASLISAVYFLVVYIAVHHWFLKSVFWSQGFEDYDFHLWLLILTIPAATACQMLQGCFVVKLAFWLLVALSAMCLINAIAYRTGYTEREFYLTVYGLYPVARLGIVSLMLLGMSFYDADGENRLRRRVRVWTRDFHILLDYTVANNSIRNRRA